jgi:hypothetical protein
VVTEKRVTRAIGSEWKNPRGQVFVCVPDHPNSRSDGLYPRARLAMEAEEGRFLLPAERVLHLDGDAGNDNTSNTDATELDEITADCLARSDFTATWGNLVLFPDQKALAQFRSAVYQARKAEGLKHGDAYAALTPAQRAYQEQRREELLVEQRARDAEAAEQRRLTALRASAARRREKGR